jgi:hypothetical protein
MLLRPGIEGVEHTVHLQVGQCADIAQRAEEQRPRIADAGRHGLDLARHARRAAGAGLEQDGVATPFPRSVAATWPSPSAATRFAAMRLCTGTAVWSA